MIEQITPLCSRDFVARQRTPLPYPPSTKFVLGGGMYITSIELDSRDTKDIVGKPGISGTLKAVKFHIFRVPRSGKMFWAFCLAQIFERVLGSHRILFFR